MITNDFQKWQNRIPPRWERKGKKWKAPETGMPRRAYLSTSQKRWPTKNFQKESELKEGKNEKKRKRDLPR